MRIAALRTVVRHEWRPPSCAMPTRGGDAPRAHAPVMVQPKESNLVLGFWGGRDLRALAGFVLDSCLVGPVWFRGEPLESATSRDMDATWCDLLKSRLVPSEILLPGARRSAAARHRIHRARSHVGLWLGGCHACCIAG
jgi:hypothetical protein